jgi:prepilin-type N-terminal cleavage/methylation domain-containing protein
MKTKTDSGFTIVELLIVIVVIAILAAITIVSYNGIRNRSIDSAIRVDAENAAKVIASDFIVNGVYPNSTSVANGGKGIAASGTNAFYYQANNATDPPFFSVVACNPESTSYYQVTSTNLTPTVITSPAPSIKPYADDLKWVEGSVFTGSIGPQNLKYYGFYASSGSTVTMNVSYNCTQKPTIQWQSKPNGGSYANIPGATNKTYITPVLNSSNDGDAYRAVITNSFGTDQHRDTIMIMDYDP